MLICACTFHVNRLGLYIILPKIHIHRNTDILYIHTIDYCLIANPITINTWTVNRLVTSRPKHSSMTQFVSWTYKVFNYFYLFVEDAVHLVVGIQPLMQFPPWTSLPFLCNSVPSYCDDENFANSSNSWYPDYNFPRPGRYWCPSDSVVQ